jgi:hypothetical protein
MATLWRARGLIAVGLVLGTLALVRPAASAGTGASTQATVSPSSCRPAHG